MELIISVARFARVYRDFSVAFPASCIEKREEWCEKALPPKAAFVQQRCWSSRAPWWRMFLVFGTSAKRKKAKTALFAPNNQAQWPTYNYRSIKIMKVSKNPDLKARLRAFVLKNFYCVYFQGCDRILWQGSKHFFIYCLGCSGPNLIFAILLAFHHNRSNFRSFTVITITNTFLMVWYISSIFCSNFPHDCPHIVGIGTIPM